MHDTTNEKRLGKQKSQLENCLKCDNYRKYRLFIVFLITKKITKRQTMAECKTRKFANQKALQW